MSIDELKKKPWSELTDEELQILKDNDLKQIAESKKKLEQALLDVRARTG
jgi:hypothetical protein